MNKETMAIIIASIFFGIIIKELYDTLKGEGLFDWGKTQKDTKGKVEE